jgi:hypothetical protein
MNAAEPQPRAPAMILEDSARLNADEHEQPAATLRLRRAVGEELARLLLQALAGDHRRAGLRAVRA